MSLFRRFLDCEKWRKEFAGGVENLVVNFDYKERGQVFKYYPQYYHKTDKDGRPLYIEQLGKINLTELRKITTDERMLSNLVVEYEKVADPRLPACSREKGHLLETCCTLLDASGVGLYSAKEVYGYLQQTSGVSQNYYPERLGKMYVINAPWGFSAAFNLIKKFLDPVTVSKIHILGANYQKELLAQIPAENLPEMFGGKCRCPNGCTSSDAGPWQNKEYATTPAWAKRVGIMAENLTSSEVEKQIQEIRKRDGNVLMNDGQTDGKTQNGNTGNGENVIVADGKNDVTDSELNSLSNKEKNGVAAKATEANLDEGTKTEAKGGIDQRVG